MERAKNPGAYKDDTKNYLPVVWQHNQKTWVIAILLVEWFYQCFIPKVKKQSGEEGLHLKCC
jgi:hypothetical protein